MRASQAGAASATEERGRLERLLAERFSIDHTTLQVDHRAEAPLAQIGSATDPLLQPRRLSKRRSGA